jgi:hypothetical protein
MATAKKKSAPKRAPSKKAVKKAKSVKRPVAKAMKGNGHDKPANGEALANWGNLNDALRAATETEAHKLMDAERAGKKRLQYLLRIYSRFNRERAKRERGELSQMSVS